MTINFLFQLPSHIDSKKKYCAGPLLEMHFMTYCALCLQINRVTKRIFVKIHCMSVLLPLKGGYTAILNIPPEIILN